MFMVSLGSELQLRPDELAFYFRSELGVEAHELGVFLQRAATVTRRRGIELRVTATRPGSLAVVLRAIRKSKTVRAAKKEFAKAPLAAAVSGATLVGLAASAIIHAMSPDVDDPSPLARAGADVVDQSRVTQIEVVTIQNSVLVMNEDRAKRIREIQSRPRTRPPELSAPEVQELIGYAREGSLSGAILDVGGELHFRPDGYRYLVPIDLGRSEAREEIYPDAHFRVRAEILTLRGQPDYIVIHSAHRV
jgi:hypothetical protein